MRTRSVILGSTLLAMLGCGDEVTSPGGPAALAAGRGTAAAVADSAILVFAGDIHANCGRYDQANATAALVQRFPAALVIPLGDNAGIHGTAAEYECYGQTWGAFKGRTYATIGNHELNQDTAGTAHYDYFNGVGVDSGRAGYRGRGNYTLDRAGWRIFVANTHRNIDDQTAWMTREQAADPRQCTMAIWHSPLFISNASVVGYARMRPWWKVLYSGGADVVVNGHAHVYERFAKVTPYGVVDPERGIREFVAGTGGGNLMRFVEDPHSASRRRVRAWGVLKLTLWPTRYRWQFIDINGVVRDSGGDSCH
jgi:hypothetical protein